MSNQVGRRVAVNPEHVAAVSEFQGDEDVARRFCTRVAEVIFARLTAEGRNEDARWQP